MKLNEFESQITEAVEELSNSVVSINSTRFARDNQAGFVPVEGAGSGVIIDKSGYIVTNNHVIDNAAMLRINLKDGRTLNGKIVGVDPATDLALIKVDAKDLPAAKLADSQELKSGQITLAIGNALGLPGGHTVSTGVVSAINRPLPGTDFIFEGLIQTDAAINPGNSGGALADIHGNVIGINTMIIKNAQGVGFAIPINTAKKIVKQILETGKVVRPWVGIYGLDINPSVQKRFDLKTDNGVLIIQVMNNSPAALSKLRAGDIIRKVGNKEVKRLKDLLIEISKIDINQETTLDVIREGVSGKVKIKLSEAPNN
ncbi:MAG: S1C family serine protease [Candidatus Bilamarchaeum sp.]|jgi:S1-C subfamily serine protease